MVFVRVVIVTESKRRDYIECDIFRNGAARCSQSRHFMLKITDIFGHLDNEYDENVQNSSAKIAGDTFEFSYTCW